MYNMNYSISELTLNLSNKQLESYVCVYQRFVTVFKLYR